MTDQLTVSIDIDALARVLAKQLESRFVKGSRYYSAVDNPLGKRRFLNLAKRGAFPTFCVDDRGKLLALRSDVEAWIESQVKPVSVKSGDEDEIDRALGKLYPSE